MNQPRHCPAVLIAAPASGQGKTTVTQLLNIIAGRAGIAMNLAGSSGVAHTAHVWGAMLGFGVKFHGEGTQMAGQNERSFPVVIQYVDDKSYVVWPKSQSQREAVLPLPAGTTYSYK